MKIAQGQFPEPIELGPRMVGWLESDIDEWITQQVKRSREDGAWRNRRSPNPSAREK